MVVKIQPAAANVAECVRYNEEKVSTGEARVIFSSKIDDPSNPMGTFQRYENANIRTEKPSFHMSVNPSITDNMDADKAAAFIKDLMEGLGYGNQPYIVYEHNDNGRKHYHVVSIRVDEEGHRINKQYERVRCQQLMKELAPKYGFEIGKGKGEKESFDFNPYKGFDPERGEISQQIEKIVRLAMRYHFTTERQFQWLLEGYGVKVDFVPKADGKMEMWFAGLNPKTKNVCTNPINGKDLKVPEYEKVMGHAQWCEGRIKNKEKDRVASIALACLEFSKSELHFQRMLHKKGIDVYLSKKDDGSIFGATFIDHRTKCCFKASELKGVSASLMEEARLGTWEMYPTNSRDKDEEEDSKLEILLQAAIDAIAKERDRERADEQIMKDAQRHKRTIYG